MNEENERLKEEYKHLCQSYYDLHEKYYKIKQENERLKTNNKTQKRRRKKQTHKKNIYKSRCKKAIEILLNIDEDMIYSQKYNVFEDIDYAIHILQNGSDDND